MSNPLSNLATDNTIQEGGDSLGGYSALESDVYKMKIDKAFITLSAKKATAINLHFTGENNATLRVQLWATSGEDKGCKNYYVNKKTNEKHYLPGFNQINALCLLTLGQEVSTLSTEKKNIKLYDATAKKEVVTEVDMLMPLLGQEILVGVIKQTVDKRAKDAASGQYMPTGEIRTENEIDKFFCAKDDYFQLTLTEIKDKITTPAFFGAWLKKWKGQIKDKTTKNVPAPGAPQAAGAQAAQTSIFN